MKKKTPLLVLAVFVASFCALLTVTNGHAFAATKTWTGAGGDTNMNTAGNWGGSAPSAGDDLVFPVSITNRTVVNNYTAATSFNSITFSGTTATCTGNNYTISGNSMTLVAGITSSMVCSGSNPYFSNSISAALILSSTQSLSVSSDNIVNLNGAVSGSGALTKTGSGMLIFGVANTFSGSLTISAGLVSAYDIAGLGSSAGGTTVGLGAGLYISVANSDKNGTLAEPLTINGATFTNGSTTQGSVSIYAGCGFGACDVANSNITLSGAIVLGADVKLSAQGVVTITGALSGAHTIGLSQGNYGHLVVNSSSNTSQTANGSYDAPVVTTEYSGNSPSTSISVGKNETAILTGLYSGATVGEGGLLKGTGSVVGDLGADSGGHVAPGLSPGCLTAGSLSLGGGSVYDVELGGTTACSGYDQLHVSGAVVLGDEFNGAPILALTFYGGFKPSKGQTFTIINNDGTDGINSGDGNVTTRFANLPEGGTFTVDGTVFRISYVGGDGNDVVLTVLSVPSGADTGLRLIKANPLLGAAVTVICSTGILAIARRNYKFGN